jgi:hypothetical protein
MMRRLLGALRTGPLRWLLVAAVLATSAAAACGGAREQAAPVPETTPPDTPSVIEPPQKSGLTVERVVDVRTVQLSDGEEVTVRGLAAPDACWADAATTFAKSVLLGKPVEPGPDGTLRLSDGTDYGVLAVELGMVRSESADDRLLKDAETAASGKRIGRWGPPCTQPATTTPPPAPAPATTAAPAPKPGCAVTYQVTTSWPGGFRTDVTIRNTGTTAVNGWTLQWKFTDGQTISQMWNATPKQTGGDVSATAVSYNQTIPPGESQLMGFLGTSGGTNTAPRAFTLNGQPCATG